MNYSAPKDAQKTLRLCSESVLFWSSRHVINAVVVTIDNESHRLLARNLRRCLNNNNNNLQLHANQRNAKLTIGRQEQSRKILELRAEIDTLKAQAKESHEQGYVVICSKDEEITELKKEHSKCQEELKNLKKSMGLLRRKGRFDWEQVPDTLQLRIKMIHDEIREMKNDLAISKTPRFQKDIKERALGRFFNSRPVKEATQNGYAYWIAIKELAEECSAAPFDIVQPQPIYKVQGTK